MWKLPEKYHHDVFPERVMSCQSKIKEYIDGLNQELKSGDEVVYSDFCLHRSRYSTILNYYEKARVGENISVLEIGVGYGFTGRYITASCRYVGLDIDLKNIIYENVKSATSVFNLENVSNGAMLPYRNDEFDLVIFCEVFEHLHPYKIDCIVREAKRVLKKNDGVILLSTPNLAAIENRVALAFGGIRFHRDGGVINPCHAREYTYKELKHIFARNGLVVKKMWFEPSRSRVTINDKGKIAPESIFSGIFRYPILKNLFRLFLFVPKMICPRFCETVYFELVRM